jgi:hypothetical protein
MTKKTTGNRIMTTLCRCDWVEAYGNRELQLSTIDPLNLPTTSLEKMAVNTFGYRAPKYVTGASGRHDKDHDSNAASVV